MQYETLEVQRSGNVLRVRLNRVSAANALNALMVDELRQIVSQCGSGEGAPTILVLEGAADVFCTGGDFDAIAAGRPVDPAPLYDLWAALAAGPFVSIALVRGRANAGGVGLAAACDLVLCDRSATFALSEMLFGLYPACVLPFLVRRVGVQKAHAMSLTTRPIAVDEAVASGLADAAGPDAETLLAGYLQRISKLSRSAVADYKRYMAELSDLAERARPLALAANRTMFDDPTVRHNISRYVREMKFPWET